MPPSAKLHLFAADASDDTAARLDRQHATISRLARLESIQLSPFAGTGAAQVVVDEATFALPLEGVIDLDAEQDRAFERRRCCREGTRQPRPAPRQSRTSPSAPSPKRSKRRAPTMTPKSAEAERLRAALERLG